MGDDRYAMSAFHLRFHDDAVETAYRGETLERTLLFCRGTWALSCFLVAAFALLDGAQFGDRASVVLPFRAVLVLTSMIVFGATFLPRLRPLFVASSALFILLNGSFSTLLVTLDDRTLLSPYFTGQIFVFAGIYSTVGLGFRFSLLAMWVTAGLFLLTVGVLAPVPTNLIVLYSFFMMGAVFVFTYAAYIAERVSRERFAGAEQLRKTVRDVKKLSGMLPICASCKKVRDDKGYWSQIESYISEHSEAVFSHGVCPDCADELYPDFTDEETHESDVG